MSEALLDTNAIHKAFRAGARLARKKGPRAISIVHHRVGDVPQLLFHIQEGVHHGLWEMLQELDKPLAYCLVFFWQYAPYLMLEGQSDMTLRPMSPYERRMVYLFTCDYDRRFKVELLGKPSDRLRPVRVSFHPSVMRPPPARPSTPLADA